MKMKRMIALMLLLCMVISMLPPMQIAQAAQTMRRYELDKDGIDAGATYLIVNTSTNGTGYAFRRSNTGFESKQLTVQTDENGVRYIESGFTDEATSQFQFSAGSAGSITQGNYKLNLSDENFVTGNPENTLTFTNAGNGAYRIHYSTTTWFWSTTYYLRYNNGWSRSQTNSTVYLFKMVEYELSYDVHFNGNGYTSGTLPQDVSNLKSGAEYIVPEPVSELRKDVGEDTWLFLCWNTKPDGSGTEYEPGDKITITEDLTLYADWYPQTKYTVTMITELDGVRTDVEQISGQDKTFAVQLDGGDGSFISLKKTATGTYSAKVVENGDYIVYAHTGDGKYEPVHGHKVTIYNQDGQTVCQHFSVVYDTNGGSWAEGEDPGVQIHHAIEDVLITDKTPTLEGNRFLGWKCQDGETHMPGEHIHDIQKKMTLTAQWEKTVSVNVNITIQHKPDTGGMDQAETRDDVSFQVMRTDENGYNHPMGMIELTEKNPGQYIYSYDEENNTSYYTLPEGQVTLADLQKGTYTVSVAKSSYDVEITSQTDSEGNVTVQVLLKYNPSTFDLNFDVQVADWENVPQQLRPQAVNIKVNYWGYNSEGVLGWHTITQQDGANPPVTVAIDPTTGKGQGFYPVWRYWSSDDGVDHPYYYRILVSSYVMPDGTVEPASEEKYTTYTAGIYTGTVTIVPSAGVPDYPTGSAEQTDLVGSIYDVTTEKQDSIPTLTVNVTPFAVTFDAGDGTIDTQQQLILENQYRFPDLSLYTAKPNTAGMVFVGWCDQEGNQAVNQAGQLLTSDVTYVARYSEDIVLSGTVEVATTYKQDEQTVSVHAIDLPEKVIVLVRKQVGEQSITVASQTVPITYQKGAAYGIGNYKFPDLTNDGTVYQVHVLPVNYTDSYDNDLDGKFAGEEEIVLVEPFAATAQVNVRLEFSPEFYQQGIQIDASQIAEGLRPTNALAQILYRDLGNIHNYQVISQHTVDPFGIETPLDADGIGLGFDDIWIRHVNGTLYEYQLQLYKLYGTVDGAYMEQGTEVTADSPFTVVYGPPNNYLRQTAQKGVMLEATLVPKEYPVYLDLNLGKDTDTPIYGMEHFMADDGKGGEHYVYMHTWSYGSSFEAFPYREGYVFTGWEEVQQSDINQLIIDNGTVHVGATLAHPVTLVAQWEPLSGTDYSIRYLELNTDKVLHGARAVSGAIAGDVISANEEMIPIHGYQYAGAMVGDIYYDKESNPSLTIDEDPLKNLMVIYYLPDASSGYTEQVESNMSANKTAVLENNGTYTITLDTHTTDNPITTKIQQNTPLDVVLVLDQSGSLAENDYLTGLKLAVTNFVDAVADHGRQNAVDHRIAIVGFAGDEDDAHSSESLPTGGKESDTWINTGVFDSNGEYHLYNVKGFNYTKLSDVSSINPDGTYYTSVMHEGKEKFLLLRYHEEYRHLITEDEARVAILKGEQIYGYAYDEQGKGSFVELTRNSSGLWLYGNKQLYSQPEFFTYHTDVWTHRDGMEPREIHAYGVGAAYRPVDGHEGVYTRTETTANTYQQDIYVDALVPVSLGTKGSGGTHPGLKTAIDGLGSDGATRASYGMIMANKILEENPVDPAEGRLRLVLMFTDGEPGYMGFDDSSGDEYYQQAVTEANNAIAQAYIAKNEHDAYVYTIGLQQNTTVDDISDMGYYMNALSSNYRNAQNMDDIKKTPDYISVENNTAIRNGGSFFVRHNNNSTYCRVEYGYVRPYNARGERYCWYYEYNDNYYQITTTTNPTVSNGKLGNYTIYRGINGYQPATASGYYATTENAGNLKEYFINTLKDITTKVTKEIVLHDDTILRDIMNQGLVLTDGTVITAYLQEGTLNQDTGEIIWKVNDETGEPVLDPQVSLTVGDPTTFVKDEQTGAIYAKSKTNDVKILVYNLEEENTTDPTDENYHPHIVDITGYNFADWYIDEKKPTGYKMVVTITRIEAMDNVQWGRATATNQPQSGVWLPQDQFGNRELLLPFKQPYTIFVERAYVLDYGKEFTLSGWYFDDEFAENGVKIHDAQAIHVDCEIENGMNWFGKPNTTNTVDGAYGNTKYGNVTVNDDGTVTYTPTTMNWGGHDQFYVFGNTWRKTVKAQEANENGNLWNKVTVIPANNIYYEDSFITESVENRNGIEGFTFTGQWQTLNGTNAGQNVENPEQTEAEPDGKVHGWTDALDDDKAFTDNSAHGTGMNGELGASAEFTFTGTGVDVYTRTNLKSGLVVAVLSRTTDGKKEMVKSLAIDNLSASGEYYHIPTVSFQNLVYGTYSVQLIATSTNAATEYTRYEYYIDGIRVYNPLGSTTNYQPENVKDAYGLETNAVFTEVRDVLLDYGDFNTGLPDDNEGKMGAVFIDWIQPGQEGEGDLPGEELPDTTGKKPTYVDGQPTYNLGTFETYGPKNEVYLTAGQAIVLKVDEANTYYVGLKSLKGDAVTAHVSGLSRAEPAEIALSHTTDMYYRVTPVGGYIVIQNANTDEAILSITKLRTTNLTEPAKQGGILPLTEQEAVAQVRRFAAYMAQRPEPEPEEIPEAPKPNVTPDPQQQAQANQLLVNALFAYIRQWLGLEEV